MMYPLYDYKKRVNSSNSPVIAVSEEAREILHYINKTIYMLTSQYDEVTKTPEILENLNKLSNYHKESYNTLDKPSFIISTIGTTSSGKSTFVNSLLGSKLSPMSADELTVGSLKFDYNSELKNNCKLSVESQISNKFWENGTSTKSFGDTYKYIRSIMETYRIQAENQKLSPPHITVSTSYLVGNNPVFLGLDPNVQLEIMELPWMIIDSESLESIVNKVKSSLIIFLIDYTVLFNKESKETNQLFQKLMDMKKEVGNTNAVIFALNKIDLKNYDDDELEIVLNKCKREIKKRLNINEDIRVIPLNSLLMYYVQTAYLSYENGNLSATYNPDSSIELTNDQKVHFEIIKDSLKKCFKDQARLISDLQDTTEENVDMISEIKRNLKKDKIPAFPVFKKFWQECLKRAGGAQLFEEIRTKSKDNMRNLLLFSSLNNIINESNSLLLNLKEQVKIGKNRDKRHIEKDQNYVFNVFNELKEKLERFRSELHDLITQSLKDIRNIDKNSRLVHITNLDIGQIEEIIPNLKSLVKRENFFPIERAFINEIRPDTLTDSLIKDYSWNSDFAKQISEHFDFLRMKLFSEKKYIDEGRKFVYQEDDEYEKQKLEDIKNQFRELCRYLVYSIDERMKFEIQNTIDELSIRVNRWLNKKVREIHEEISLIIEKFENNHNFDIANPTPIKSYKYQGVFYDKFTLSPLFTSGKEYMQRKSSPIVPPTIERPKKAWYQFWISDVEPAPIVQVEEEEKAKEYTSFPSVITQADSWAKSFSEIEDHLWGIICDSLDSFFAKAFTNYDLAISEMFRQIESIVAFENNKIQDRQNSITTKWNNIDNIYLQINKLTDKMYDISLIPKPDREIYTRQESEIQEVEEENKKVDYEETPVIEHKEEVVQEPVPEVVYDEPTIQEETVNQEQINNTELDSETSNIESDNKEEENK
ncbi:MAG: dynamin family protein [Candidatus Sericytochromatia bacterium]